MSKAESFRYYTYAAGFPAPSAEVCYMENTEMALPTLIPRSVLFGNPE